MILNLKPDLKYWEISGKITRIWEKIDNNVYEKLATPSQAENLTRTAR